MLHERYSLFEVIGRGRGGVVRRGFDHVLKRDAAVKTMEDTPEARREVQMLGQLQHPRIAGFCDAVIHKGKIHLIMELGRGGTSRQRRLTLEDLLEVGQDAAEALSYLHNLGLSMEMLSRRILFSSMTVASSWWTLALPPQSAMEV